MGLSSFPPLSVPRTFRIVKRIYTTCYPAMSRLKVAGLFLPERPRRFSSHKHLKCHPRRCGVAAISISKQV